MFNYVNEEKFFDWYTSVSKTGIGNKSALLAELVSEAGGPGEKTYTVPAAGSVTGRDESYTYKVDNLGCCGASTIYIYF